MPKEDKIQVSLCLVNSLVGLCHSLQRTGGKFQFLRYSLKPPVIFHNRNYRAELLNGRSNGYRTHSLSREKKPLKKYMFTKTSPQNTCLLCPGTVFISRKCKIIR